MAGLDLEMPGPSRWRSHIFNHVMSSKKFSIDILNQRVTNVLNLVNRAAKSGVATDQPETTREYPEDRALLRKLAADGIVLMKNEKSILPFSKEKTVR